MRATIRKWGNSLAMRIPAAAAKELRFDSGTEVELTIEEGKLVLSPPKEPEYKLEDLLKGVTKRSLHAESDWGGRAGREAW